MVNHKRLKENITTLNTQSMKEKQSEGKWIWIDQAIGYLDPPYGDTCKCSLCGFVIDISNSYYKYCPNCGVRMNGERDGTGNSI